MAGGRRYRYVGPEEIRREAVRAGSVDLRSAADVVSWMVGEPVTFVVTVDGTLRVAPRRSEHVACADGEPVLAAGELIFAGGGEITEATNQSTGYCPDPGSWAAVAAAAESAGFAHPGRFTYTVVFRRCPDCRERNIVRDDDFTCALCGGELPARWNFGPG
ncbi:hypothetical protein [Catenuloplanes japonicus]|uniref:hypothetical protein n=1 Tax=Catenuloplanes japonicus TaxID=33876 RepID=UPI000527BB93|nr:hypothetical protein [Catenuloplanes japonicus]